MRVSQPHNQPDRLPEEQCRFGIRVTLPPGDTFTEVLGGDWESFHWFPDASSRDEAMRDMARRHRYSRIGDDPRIRLEALER